MFKSPRGFGTYFFMKVTNMGISRFFRKAGKFCDKICSEKMVD